MITREDADRLRDELLGLLVEDPHNTRRLLDRLDAISRERGIGAHSALLLILTHLGFEEQEARHHWGKILEHQRDLSARLGREAGVRVAVLDYFVNVNQQLQQPTLIDLEMLELAELDATRDTKTGLATDRVFRGQLQHELRRARRYGQQAAVVVFDLDDFAQTNARVGPLVGDRVLREAAILLSNNVRDIDVAARSGEDEFVLLLPETDRNGALLVAERYRREAERFFAKRGARGQDATLTVSGGIACYPEDATSPESLLERAAQALYHAKACGKNTVRVYQPERRTYLRFELDPGRFEVEVVEPAPAGGRIQNLSRNGILFLSPERLELGERIEIRIADPVESSSRPLRVHGSVVRLEALPEPLPVVQAGGAGTAYDHFEIGVAFDPDWGDGLDDLIDFLERARRQRPAE